jgi:Invasin, domain 3
MLNLKLVTGAALLLALTACGGGGGNPGSSGFGTGGGSGSGSGGTSTGVPSNLSVTLVDVSGNAITPPVVTATTVFSVRVAVTDSTGSAVANRTVAVSAPDLTLTPSSGQKLSDSVGVSVFPARQTDASLTSTTSVCASVTTTAGSDGSITRCIDVQLGAVSATLGTVTVASPTLDAYQTTSVSVPLTVTGTSTPVAGAPVSFTTTCGVVSPATAITNSLGFATVSYTNSVSSGATSSSCSGTVTITASTQSGTRTGTLTAIAPAAANIQFVEANPQRIYLAGSPGVSNSQVSFKLVDAEGNPIAGETVTLKLESPPTGAYLGSIPGTEEVSPTTDGTGRVTTSVNAGSAPGPVQIKASFNGTPKLSNVSNALAIASGLPTQSAFSLSVSTFNIEAAETDGVNTTLTVRAADRLGNPVPDGTTINFIAESGGQIVADCKTTGAASNSTSACSVTLSSQDTRPSNNRITVLAWAQGEESFVDNSVPSNNVFDVGIDGFTSDLGQPFRDDDFDGVYDAGEPSVGTAAPGSAACPVLPGLTIKPNTCSGGWGQALVSATTEIVFSDSTYDPTVLSPTFSINSGASRCTLAFVLKDKFGNPLPAGTQLSVSNIKGGKIGGEDASLAGFGGEGDQVPNTNNVDRTTHSAVFSECSAPSSLTFTVNVTTPAGRKTSFFY